MKNSKLSINLKRFFQRRLEFEGLSIAYGELFLFFLIIFLYFLTRLYRLTILPVFADEAIYVRWAQVMRAEPTLRFISLQDGKQPLFMWLVIPALKIFADPLFAGRFISVLSGLAVMLGLGALTFVIFRKVKTALLAMFLYLVVPWGLFFDRMALVDGLLSALAVWSLVFAIILGETRRLDSALILGMILGGGLLTKSPGMFFVLMAPMVAIVRVELFPRSDHPLNNKVQNGLRALLLLAVSLIFAFGIYNILRLGPNFHMIKIRNKDYVWPISEILKHPLDPLIPHLKDVVRYYYSYLTLPIFTLGILGALGILKKKKKRLMGIVLLTWWLAPLLVEAAIAKTFTGRYILFSLPVFLLFVAYGIENLKSQVLNFSVSPQTLRLLEVFLLGLILVPPLVFDWRLWTDPAKASLPRDDYAGYLEDWTAGWGIKETADYVKEISRAGNKVVVGTEGFFGTLPDGLQIYLEKEPGVTVLGVGVPVKSIANSLKEARASGNKTYLLVNKSRFYIKNESRLKLVKVFKKPGGDELLFFEVLGAKQQ